MSIHKTRYGNVHSVNRQLSRRRVMQGLGVSAALAPFVPLLESAAGGAESPPKRFVVFHHPHGTIHEHWRPTGTTKEFTLPMILEPLDPLRHQLVVIDGLDVHWDGPPGGPHVTGPGYVHTGSPMQVGTDFQHLTSGGPHGWPDGPSVDQVIANAIGDDTAFRSLEFGVQTGWSYPGGRISYRAPAVPLAPQPDPYFQFNRIFGELGLDPAVLAAIKSRRQNVLDVVRPQLNALKSKVSVADRIKIQEHAAGIDALQTTLDAEYECEVDPLQPGVDFSNPANVPEVSRQHLDLMVDALACGVTNVASIMYKVGDNDNAPYPWLGIEEGHHALSHSGPSDDEARFDLAEIYRWYAGELHYFANELENIIEPDGSTMLDNTLIFWASELAIGNEHTWHGMPFVLLGGAGAIEREQFLQFDGENHCQLLVAMCNAMGLDITSFGGFDDGSGALPGLLT
ncbi:MAG: DUF1552 domain-containing protein [Myxococcota bacterium]